MQFAAAPGLTSAASFVKLHLFSFGGTVSLNGKRGRKMATSSITANFAIRDEKEAKAFIAALLSDSRSMVPPARKRNWKLVGSVKEIERRLGACA